MATTTSGSNITTTGRIQSSDLNDIANHFRQWFSVSFTAPSGRIMASDFNNLRQAILNGAGTAYSISQLPGTVSTNQRITSTTWGYATANFSSTTINYTSNGSYTIPVGCNSLTINQLVAGGGGGQFASASGTASEATSGGGGSGGFQSNYTISVSAGDVISVDIGGGGTNGSIDGSATDGGSSFVQLNGNTILTCSGGQHADAAHATRGQTITTSGGGSGSPNGNSGGTPAGGNSPYNGYGAGGNGGHAEGLDGVNKESFSSGSSGSSGYCSITYNP